MNGNRTRDMEVDNEVVTYLDNNVYPKIGAKIKRYFDRETQMKGIDIHFTYKDLKNVTVDEKTLTHYINKDLPTFAFELSFINKGDVIEGWFTDTDKVTEYYMIVWLRAKKEWDIKHSDITHAQLYLVSRNKISEYLSENGFDTKTLREKTLEIRKKDVEGALEKGVHNGFYFYYSKKLVEMPINVVVSKSVLKSLAEYTFAGPNIFTNV
ncbi:MAG: hypothetical protein V4606_02110 [Patescibacteria group bacterium]